MEDILKRLATSFVAGFLITLGCVANLKMGGIVGGVLFSFALLSIIVFHLDLLTGAFGYSSFEWGKLGLIFVGNMLGCLVGGLIFGSTMIDIKAAASTLISQRETAGLLSNFLLAIPCGIIVTIAIGASSEDTFLPLLIGVPIFVLCGMPHCVADAGYIAIAGKGYWGWLLTIVGNYIGCNFYRLYLWEFSNKEEKTTKKIGFN